MGHSFWSSRNIGQDRVAKYCGDTDLLVMFNQILNHLLLVLAFEYLFQRFLTLE